MTSTYYQSDPFQSWRNSLRQLRAAASYRGFVCSAQVAQQASKQFDMLLDPPSLCALNEKLRVIAQLLNCENSETIADIGEPQEYGWQR